MTKELNTTQLQDVGTGSPCTSPMAAEAQVRACNHDDFLEAFQNTSTPTGLSFVLV